MKRLVYWMAGLLLVTGPVLEAAPTMKIRLDVRAGKHDRKQTPLVASVPLPVAKIASSAVILTDAAGRRVAAQLTAPRLLHSKQPNAELHWILRGLKAGASTGFGALDARFCRLLGLFLVYELFP